MPTPVSAARQCLAGEAAVALDEAVAVARRRAHAQTTSLHVVSALLSLPSSSSSSSLLRDALARARSAAYGPRLQLKALELSFSVALDRLPSANPGGRGGAGDNHAQQEAPAEPPVSNSLMAAIKRSQANQRRNPDTFHLYQHQQLNNSPSSFAGVKVELRQLVLSILDDPVVSRVFGDAGFRSCDVKFAVLRPPPSFLRFPRTARCPPLFLCNFSVGPDELDVAPRGFSFPFSSQPLYSDGADENCRRIAEMLARKKGRNPLLVGVGASEAARDFERALGRQKWAAFPPELRGVQFFSIEKEVSDFVRNGWDQSWLGARFSELGLWLAAAAELRPSPPGIVLGIGELEVLVDVVWEDKAGDGLGGVSFVVSELTKFVEGHPGRFWLIGSVATYETYMKFLAQYPSADKDWDLQLLPVTTLKPGSVGLCSRPSSLMESFAPFGGLFPVANNSVAPLIRQNQPEVPCHLCSDKYDQEIAALLNEFSVSVEEKWLENLPQLQQIDPTSINGPLDVEKAKDDGTILNAKVGNLRKKWNDICQRLHQGSQTLEADTFQVESGIFSHAVAHPCAAVKEGSGNETNRDIDKALEEGIRGNIFPASLSLQKISANGRMSLPAFSASKNEDLASKLQSRHSKRGQFQTNGSRSNSRGLSDAGAPDERTSSSSGASVSTDLILGTVHSSPGKGDKSMMHPHHEPSCEAPPCLELKKTDVINGNASAVGASATDKRKLCLSNANEPFDTGDLKAFSSSLAGKVGGQEEAARAVCRTLARCRAGNERFRGVSLRGDVWLGFLGPDRVGKRKIAMALAELLFGGRDKLITVDLSLQDGLMPSSTVCSSQDAYRGLNFRGKTMVDHIAEEISKNPCSVVLLENVDEADFLVQGSLSQAIKTGKFSDSHGREVGVNSVVFVVTAGVKRKTNFSDKCTKFSEEDILAVRPRKMRILVEYASDSAGRFLSLDAPGESRSGQVFVGKRKMNMAGSGNEQHGSVRSAKQAKGTLKTFLDLNLPVEEIVADDTACRSDESSSISENTEAWLKEFLGTVDETVFFKPFDFDALADDVLKEIKWGFQTAMRSDCVLEIDPRVMEQILAAVWLSEGKAALSNWLQQVLVRSFMEAQQTHKLSSKMVLRLAACEDVFMEGHAPGILLPSQVLLG